MSSWLKPSNWLVPSAALVLAMTVAALAQNAVGGLGSLIVQNALQQGQSALQTDLIVTYRGPTGAAVIGPASAIQSGGPTPPTLSGSCASLGTQVGGNTAGSFVATCTAQTAILTFAVAAPHGWICQAWDQTTTTDFMRQSANSTTSCTLTGTTVAGDVILFEAVAY